jgi:hypothetical protein
MKYPKNRKPRTGDAGSLEQRKAYYDLCLKCTHCKYENINADRERYKLGLPLAFKNKWKLLEHYNEAHPQFFNEISSIFSKDEIVVCPICNQTLGTIGYKHLAKHNLSSSDFKKQYPNVAMRPDFMKKIWSDRCKKINKTEYMRSCVSEANKKRILESRNKHNGFKTIGKIYSEKNKCDIPFRSKYEKRAIEILESSKDIKYYHYEKIRLRYIDEFGKKRIYIVDFVTDKKLIEVKPSWVTNQKAKFPEIIRKFAAADKWARKNGYTFEVWTEKELGLLTS